MEEVLILLKSCQETADGNTEKTRLMTTGTMEQKDNVLTLSYEDTEATGFVGSTTQITVTDGKIAALLRSGAASSNLVFEADRKHYALYQTPYGTMTIGVTGKKVELEQDGSRGRLLLMYHIDIDANFVSENMLEMCWKPQRNTKKEYDSDAGSAPGKDD